MGNSKFSKIVDHPEKKTIITKLVSGENPTTVSRYLKDKYSKPDEDHLRIPATVLKEFLEGYADHHGYVKKIVQRNADSKMEKQIADSLLDNRAWKDRLADVADKEINYLEKLDNVLTILETRAEQLFDMMQSDPEDTRKVDYVFTKYMELLMMAIEKGDKIRNDRPDVRVEHTYTVQMVEQQTVAFQEAIRETLEQMGPEHTSLFMDILGQKMAKMKPQIDAPMPNAKQIEKERASIDRLDNDVREFDQKFLEENSAE